MADIDWEYLSPLDQILPRMYFGQILCFSCADADFFQILHQALGRVAVCVPHLTSFVVDDTSRPGNVRLERGRDTIDNILAYYEEPGEDNLDYETLRKSSFPIFPRSSLFYPHIPEVPWKAPWPVMRAQVNRVRGGFMLTVLVHHCVFDGTALSQLLSLWATCCSRDPVDQPLEINQSHLDRRALLESDLKCEPSQPSDIVTVTTRGFSLFNMCLLLQRQFGYVLRKPLPHFWPITLYRLPSGRLESLKKTLNQFASSLGVRFLSTNDIICALVWSCATAAMSTKFQRLNLADTCSTGISVNVRSKLQPRLPDDFLGCAMGVAYINMARRKLYAAAERDSIKCLARVAAAVRRGVDGVTNTKMKEIINYVERQEDSSKLQWRPKKLNEFYISSWANQGIYNADWGSKIGRCEALRVAQMALGPMCVILPPTPSLGKEGTSGDIELVISLQSSHMERFRKLKLVNKFAEAMNC